MNLILHLEFSIVEQPDTYFRTRVYAKVMIDRIQHYVSAMQLQDQARSSIKRLNDTGNKA